jgi:hypothetical protein
MEGEVVNLPDMEQKAIHQLLATLRETRLELEALKRMFFEHRPPFVQAFAQHREAVEASGYLEKIDEAIAAMERDVNVQV